MKDFLIVGAGLYGAVMARELTRKGYSCIVIDKRKASGGNIRTVTDHGIDVHEFGAHIFHTSDDEVWKYVTDLVPMVPFVHSPVACYKGSFYSLPFNMHTFRALFGTDDPLEAKARIEEEARAEKERILAKRRDNFFHIENPEKKFAQEYDGKKLSGKADDTKTNDTFLGNLDRDDTFTPANLEEQALTTIGRTVYETLIKGYTAKQWGRDPKELSADIIKRIPIRYTFNKDYFNDKYEGLPDAASGGYTGLIDRLLDGIEVRLETDYLKLRSERDPETWYKDPGLGLAKKVIYSGAIDEFFCERFGPLSYRSLSFEEERLEKEDYQGHAVVNYTDEETPYTRIIEHKYLTAYAGKDYTSQKEAQDMENGRGMGTQKFGHDPESNLPKNNKKFTVITREYPKKFEPGDERYYPVRDAESLEKYNKYAALAGECPSVTFGGRLGSYRYLDMDKVIKEALNDSRAY